MSASKCGRPRESASRNSYSLLAQSRLRFAIPMQMPDHIEAALRNNDRRRDRASPPVFVGRASELAFLHDVVAAAQSGAEGITAVVQGVPGVGKSALCRQFEKELRAAMVDDQPVAVVSKDCDFFDKPSFSMVRELAADVPVRMDLLRRLPGFEKAESHVRRGIGFATALLKRGLSLDLAMQAMNLDQSSSLGTSLDTFAENMWPAGITLILAVDEMQNMEDTPHVRRNLQAIHGKRFDTHIALVGFGLQDTTARLHSLGLSRLGADQVRTLGSMDSTDAAQLVDETFDYLGLTSEYEDWLGYAKQLGFGFESWTNWRNAAKGVILEESANFPHHLVNGIRGVCRTVLAGKPRHPGRQELSALRQQCQNSKKEYYAARLAPFANHTLALAAALRKANDAGKVDTAVVLDALEESDNNGRSTDADTATAVLDGLIDRGLLTRQGTTMVAAGVPSMISCLGDELDRSVVLGSAAAHKLRERFE